MKNITKNEIKEIREIKEAIKQAEQSLEKFMDAELSDNGTRKEMREILNSIEIMESKLSSCLANLK